MDPDGTDRYGAFKVGRHDDLVTALGLATQDDGGGRIEPLDPELVAEQLGDRGYRRSLGY